MIEIDGDDVTLKFAFIKETCKLGDIISIRFKEPMPLQWGCIEVLTKKQQSACYSIFFKKKALKEYEELYLFLLEHSSADKNEPDMLINIVQPDNKKHIPPTTPVCCPKCGSTQISANKKGFGVGKAVVGAAVAGPIGLTVGNIGSNKVIVTCLKCGHRWQAGKG